MTSAQLLSLLQLSDPTLPIGGFSHSAGLETYVQSGVVSSKETAGAFVEAQLKRNLFFTDAALASLAYEAALVNDREALQRLDEECTAVKIPKEMRQASNKLGLRLLKIFLPLCPPALIHQYKTLIDSGVATGHYAIAFGAVAAALSIPKQEVLAAFFYTAAVGMVTNSVKLIPLGQQDGQALLFSLQPLVCELAEKALSPDPSLIGLCCTGFDLRSMQHEQLYSRLYMS